MISLALSLALAVSGICNYFRNKHLELEARVGIVPFCAQDRTEPGATETGPKFTKHDIGACPELLQSRGGILPGRQATEGRMVYAAQRGQWHEQQQRREGRSPHLTDQSTTGFIRLPITPPPVVLASTASAKEGPEKRYTGVLQSFVRS